MDHLLLDLLLPLLLPLLPLPLPLPLLLPLSLLLSLPLSLPLPPPLLLFLRALLPFGAAFDDFALVAFALTADWPGAAAGCASVCSPPPLSSRVLGEAGRGGGGGGRGGGGGGSRGGGGGGGRSAFPAPT